MMEKVTPVLKHLGCEATPFEFLHWAAHENQTEVQSLLKEFVNKQTTDRHIVSPEKHKEFSLTMDQALKSQPTTMSDLCNVNHPLMRQLRLIEKRRYTTQSNANFVIQLLKKIESKIDTTEMVQRLNIRGTVYKK